MLKYVSLTRQNYVNCSLKPDDGRTFEVRTGVVAVFIFIY
jgi:hypothetical protein